MQPTRSLAQKKNLLLAFDAFGTLYQPSRPIPRVYSQVAYKHGIDCYGPKGPDDTKPLKNSFSRAYKEESGRHPNYGKATGLGAEKWWGNLIRNTLSPFLKPGQEVPQGVVTELLTRFSTKEGYDMFPDVLPFFKMLKDPLRQNAISPPWKWDKTVVGIITNSDDRVPGILKSLGLQVGPRRVGTSAQRSAEANLDEDISFVVLSYDVGYEKPDRTMFDAATEMLEETLVGSEQGLGVDDFEKLYVGDDVEKDYFGAENAGWNAVVIDRKGNLMPTIEHDGHTSVVVVDNKSESGKKTALMVRDLGALNRWTPIEKE